MPVVLKVDSRRRVVYSTFYGKVTGEELVRHGFTIASDPDFRREYSEIVDFSAVAELSISEATLKTMAGTPSLFSEGSQHIVVAATDEAFRIASKFKALAKKSRRHLVVVRTRAKAYELLGLGPD